MSTFPIPVFGDYLPYLMSPNADRITFQEYINEKLRRSD